MTEKKLFFGVSAQTVEARKNAEAEAEKKRAEAKAAEEERAAKVREVNLAQQAQREQDEKIYAVLRQVRESPLHSAFLPRVKGKKAINALDWLYKIGLMLGTAFPLLLFIIATSDIKDERFFEMCKQYPKVAYSPVTDKGDVNPVGVTTLSGLALALVAVLVMISLKKKRNAKVFETNKALYNTVKMMFDLKENDGWLDLTEEQLEYLLSQASVIVDHMSSKERVYFDLLMEGKINIKENKTFLEMATVIMCAHLRNNPQDARLVLETFDEYSLPEPLLKLCKANAM
ncbi:MAG: hypothetical protein K5912_01655 [Alphaproteobacteria bacterium]|nr:hypothetical protein [Alphaproteobacteria bacterium]